MEKFAERYVNCNPEAFKSADVAYVLAYSVIMLNTDAHNPQVKAKMSQQVLQRLCHSWHAVHRTALHHIALADCLESWHLTCIPFVYDCSCMSYLLSTKQHMSVPFAFVLQDFLRNNRGINDGGDLPEDFMGALYDRIQTNEIKMKVWKPLKAATLSSLVLQLVMLLTVPI